MEERLDRGPFVADREARVLLVDDNQHWVQFLAEDLEQHDPMLDVMTAGSANEAMLTLNEHGSIECVVADYRMPEINGLQLLERVRERRPQLPFILVTAEGSEDIASTALDIGVTDYIVKDPRTEQTALFARRIGSAVERHRIRRALTESEQRYRTVTEQSLDAIVILREDEIVFCNHRLTELLGEDRSALTGTDFFADVIHEDDRDDVRTTVRGWRDDTGGGQLNDVRVTTVDGTIRHCEYIGRSLTYESEPATLVSIRDVTERKQRERELEWERTLNRTVQEVLVGSRTRAELEAAIVDQLSGHGYALAWIGEPNETGVVTRAVEGDDTSYIDDRDFAAESDGRNSDPSIWAVESGESQFVQDFRKLFETEWRDDVLERGYRSGAALPLDHNGVSYGVLAVYHGSPGRFDETERQLLTNLADTIAYAIHSLETNRALASDHVLDATLQLTNAGYYVADLARDIGGAGEVTITVHGTLPHGGDELIQYLTVEGATAETVCDAASAHEQVSDVTVVDEDGTTRIQTVVAGPTPEADLARFGVVVRSTSVTSSRTLVRVELPAKQELRSLVETLEREYGPASMVSCVEADRSDATSLGTRAVDTRSLTDKQAAALEAAFHHGYFEQPRKSSATEIAESLGITHSTYLQHLRTAQQKVFEEVYGTSVDGN